MNFFLYAIIMVDYSKFNNHTTDFDALLIFVSETMNYTRKLVSVLTSYVSFFSPV